MCLVEKHIHKAMAFLKVKITKFMANVHFILLIGVAVGSYRLYQRRSSLIILIINSTKPCVVV